MIRSAETGINTGALWFSRLKHGAEKAFLFHNGVTAIQPDEYIFDEDLSRTAHRLYRAKSMLDSGLLGAEVRVTPLADGAEPIPGNVRGYNLHEATLILESGRSRVDMPFCEFQILHNVLSCTTLIHLQTDQPLIYWPV